MPVTGYTAGVFDLFHVGHLQLLTEARQRCDRLIVGVTTDQLCATYKHKIPVIPYAERSAIIGALRCVDEVIPQRAMDRWLTWEEHHFDITVVGDDWKGSLRWGDYERRFRQVGVKVIYLPYTAHTSSTLLRSVLERLDNSSQDHGVHSLPRAS
jgi:glycerol-3-phosphate cytidylyltransferase